MSLSPTRADSQLGGFPTERFVASSINDNLLCSICRFVFDNPVLTPCGHLFCASCLSHWLTACQTLLPSCPECRRTVFAFDVRPVRGLKNYIGSLPSYCVNRKKGCQTVLSLDDIENHEENCSHKHTANSNRQQQSRSSARSSSATTSSTTSTTTTSKNSSTTGTCSRNRTGSRVSIINGTNGTRTTRSSANTGGSLSVSVNARSSSSLPRHQVIDHRSRSSQTTAASRAAAAAAAASNRSNNNSSNNDLNDRVARLEEKLQQVRLDIEQAEQRNIWLETQLTLARNNLSLADALRRARVTTGNSRRRLAPHDE